LTGLDSNIPQHNQRVRNNIGNTHPQRRPDGLVDHILQHHHTNTTSKTASHSRKAHEQHDSRLPRDTIPAVAETITGQARLVYAVDDEHAEGWEDTGDPVDKGDVEGGAVQRRLGVAGGINQDEQRDRELSKIAVSGCV
jgi:hypothetical protein